MESDYVLRSGTINPTIDENYIKKKWVDLSIRLNSLGSGPNLLPEDWKKASDSVQK